MEYNKVKYYFYNWLKDNILENEVFIGELMEVEPFFSMLETDEGSRKMICLDWYVFDGKSRKFKKNVLEYLLNKIPPQNSLRRLYADFLENNIYGMFKIESLRMGKEMTVSDMVTGKKYTVRDTVSTRNLKKGDLIFTRLIPFDGFYSNSTPDGLGFPLKITSCGEKIRQALPENDEVDITPLFAAKYFSGKIIADKKDLTEPGNFREFAESSGLEPGFAERVIEKAKTMVEARQSPDSLYREVIESVNPYKVKPLDMKTQLLKLWNYFVLEKNPKRSVVENIIIKSGMAYVGRESGLDRSDVKNPERLAKKADKLMEKWLKTPHFALGGKEPKQAILQEHESLGIEEKLVKYSVSLTLMEPGKALRKKHRKFFCEGLALMKKDRYEEAAENFRQAVSIAPEDHVSWQNMGVCFTSLGKKDEAVDCFKKALDIRPDYKIAEDNLKIIENTDEIEFRRMARFSRYKRREEMADKKNKKFRIKMDTMQYEKLIKLAFLGNWLANSIHTVEDLNEEYREIAQFIYSKAKKAGLGWMVNYSRELGEYFPEFDENPEIDNIIEEYDEENFWETLIGDLAARDIAGEIGWKKFQKLDLAERFKIREKFEKKYRKEFKERGLERLKITE